METITPFSTQPPRLLADANFNQHVVRGSRRIRPDIVGATGHENLLDSVSDPEILAYAASHDLILLTHDMRTMPGHFAEFLCHLDAGVFSPGVWYTLQTLAVGVAIQAILETWLYSGHEEYRNRELRLP